MEERIEKTFSTPEGCDLVVENVKGQIVVEGWDRPETQVVAIRHQDYAEIEITQDGKKVIARTKHDQGPLQWLEWLTKGRTPEVDYTVHVPVASDLKLKNVSGPIKATQVRGNVRVNNVDGPATLADISGPVKAETVNGSVQVSQLQGTAKLKTVNGRLSVEEGALDDLSAETVNGEIKVVAALDARGHYAFNTVNGNCHLVLPPDFRAQVSANGVNLRVDCKVPSESVQRQFGSWHGEIGAGQGPTAEITFNTVNGHLRIDNAEPVTEPTSTATSASPEPPQPPQVPESPLEPIEAKVAAAPNVEPKSQAEILGMVERGEISVDEAINLLKEQ
jgi:hypothetical protein